MKNQLHLILSAACLFALLVVIAIMSDNLRDVKRALQEAKETIQWLENSRDKDLKQAIVKREKIRTLQSEQYHILVLDMSEEPKGTTLKYFFWLNYRNSRSMLDHCSSTIDSDETFGYTIDDICIYCKREVIVRIIYPNRIEETSYTYFKNAVK